MFFTSGSAAEEDEEDNFAAACASARKVSGHSQPSCSSSVVQSCSFTDVGTSAASETFDGPGHYTILGSSVVGSF